MSAWSRNEDRNKDEEPPYCRVFVVCNKDVGEADLKPVFEECGEITDLYIPKHRETGESRGVAYIKYTKTSSAATAIQKLHLRSLGNGKSNKPMKVMIANNKNDKDDVSVDKCDRLFIKISKQDTEDDLSQYFSKFGNVESVYIIKDKSTNESRGLAYVQFNSFLAAAIAFEECDRKYRAVFAAPKQDLKRGREDYSNDNLHLFKTPITHRDSFSDYFNDMSPHHNNPHHNTVWDVKSTDPNNINSLIRTPPQNFKSITATCTPMVAQVHLERLFNVIPGLQKFQYSMDTYNGFSRALVTYEDARAAAHAVDRLNNFEFPSGELVIVKPDSSLSKAANDLSSIVNSFKNAVDSGSPDLCQLAEAIAHASTLIKAATSGRETQSDDHLQQDRPICDVLLPATQPFAPSNSKVAQRCFIVCKPNPPPISVLKDVFCRFGDLIDIGLIPNRTFGFAKYASVRAAQDAIATLHGATVLGTRLKVMEADDRPSKTSDASQMEVEPDEDFDHEERKRSRQDEN